MTDSTLPSPYPAPGEIISDSWRVEKILGEGGMGAVARAWDLILHTPVAIKFMNPQFLTFPGAEERFVNEGKASALIKSDHVVPVMKAGKTSGGTPYLVMECLEGVDLADLLAREGEPGLPLERAVHFVVQVLRALQAAHAIGIIHRDMKPSNCFAVTKDGEDDFVKILDFGISKIQQPGSASLTQTNSALGTPLYMSPEQAKRPRDVDARSDLYSVGVMLYELLTGHTPFFSESGELTEILFKLFTADPPPVKATRPDLPDELAAAVHKALAREVDQRFASALDMAEALAPFASERSRHVLTRMRAFKAAKNSIAPPADLPRSMEAFSKLQHGPRTDVMAHRPPATETLPGGDAAGVGVAGTRHARPEDASAVTQFDPNANRSPAPNPVVVVGASTDLSTARDTSAISPIAQSSKPKRSPVLYAMPVVGALAVVGLVLGVRKGPAPQVEKDRTTAASAPPSALASTEPARSTSSNVTLPPLTPSASAEALAKPTPGASVSAVLVKVPVTRPTPAGPGPGPAPGPGPGPGTVLDTQIHH